jgi:hypothetical protein
MSAEEEAKRRKDGVAGQEAGRVAGMGRIRRSVQKTPRSMRAVFPTLREAREEGETMPQRS